MLLLPGVLFAQPDSISAYLLRSFFTHLEALPIPEDSVDQRDGALVFPNFDEGFAAAQLQLFNEKEPEADAFYQVLHNLSSDKQRALLAAFEAQAPAFSSALAAAQLPDALKYLAPAVSAMNPKAVDARKRAGLWQLNHFQAVLSGLQADRLVDERFLPDRATQAFVAQIQQNIEQFGSCEKAVLAYFAGNVALRNLLDEYGEDADYATLLAKLPDEITFKISAYQAMAVFLKTNARPRKSKRLSDTVFVRQPLHFTQVAQVLGISPDELAARNPQYPFAIVPGGEKGGQLFLPDGMRDDFLLWQDSIYSVGDSSLFALITPKIEYPPAPQRQYVGEKVKDLEIEGKTKLKYVIQSGDVLGLIAEDYDVRVADLKYWNNIFNERKIRAGATLDIFVDDDKADYYRSLQKQVQPANAGNSAAAPQKVFDIPENARRVEYVVKNGESPYVIAKKFEGVSPEAILFWNGISDARKIQIGQKLIIYLAQ